MAIEHSAKVIVCKDVVREEIMRAADARKLSNSVWDDNHRLAAFRQVFGADVKLFAQVLSSLLIERSVKCDREL